MPRCPNTHPLLIQTNSHSGAVKSYHGLLATRFFLGALEGGLFPGIVLYLSSFYKRHSLQLRISLMFSSASLAGAFSGLLAAGIQNLHARNIPGWKWIFILEGLFTTLFGIMSFFLLPRTPESTIGLTQAEKVAYRESLKRDWSGDMEDEHFSWTEVIRAFKSPQVLLICIPLFFNGATVSYTFIYFLESVYLSVAVRSRLLHSFHRQCPRLLGKSYPTPYRTSPTLPSHPFR